MGKNKTDPYGDGFDYLGGLNVPGKKKEDERTPAPVDPWEQFLLNASKGGFGGGGGSAGAYKGQAQGLLGNLDLGAFNQLRDAFNASYQTGKSSLDQSYANMLESLGKQETENKQQFGAARGTIMEDSFGRGRDMYRNLAARGLGASGLQQLGDVQNRMETGRQVSQVAGQFNDTAENIAETKSQGTEQYGTQQESLQNSLNSSLAGIAQQEIQYKNDYQKSIADIALSMQREAAATANSNRQMQMQYQAELAKYQSEKQNQSESSKIEIISSGASREDQYAMWADKFKVDMETAKRDVDARTSSYEGALKNEALETFTPKLEKIESYSDSKAFMKDFKTRMVDTGILDAEEVKAYITKNWATFGQVNNWSNGKSLLGAGQELFLDPVLGVFKDGIGALSGGAQPSRADIVAMLANPKKYSQDAVVDKILKLYGIE